jgi:hypothetical protein
MLRKSQEYIVERIKGPMVAAEVGVFKGGNALRILSMNVKELILVDPYSAFTYIRRDYIQKELDEAMKIMLERITPYIKNGTVNFLRKPSVEAAKLFPDNYFDFVYIDGDHSYEAAKADIIAWYPKVKNGGILSGHDYPTPTVEKACIEFAAEKKIKLVGWVGSKDFKNMSDPNPTPDGDKDWVMEVRR